MTHSEIYKKFFIEYDKDMITSSYPSLTLTEVCNFLNKAYFALIAQKFTGNNLRQIPFEGDVKQIEDLQPLVVNKLTSYDKNNPMIINCTSFKIPSDMLYYIDSRILFLDNKINMENVTLTSHEYAKKFMCTGNNHPWIETPVCTIDNNNINVLYDIYKHPDGASLISIDYIKTPKLFDGNNTKDEIFELSDSVIEELINLAITFVLDNVESSRISTKTNLLKLES